MTDKHPSGLTWERWEFPFKTPQEREMIKRWLGVIHEFDDSIPF